MMFDMNEWGPSHQTTSKRRRGGVRWPLCGLIALAIYGFSKGAGSGESVIDVLFGWVLLIGFTLVAIPTRWRQWLFALPSRARARARANEHVVADPLVAVRQGAWRIGGPSLGLDPDGQPRFARSERAVLLLGPPRSGKTSSVIIPAILSHTGPVVSTSTKMDVAHATRVTRAVEGRLWVFDPTGATQAGDYSLRWSPVRNAGAWDGAQLMARALTTNVGAGTTDRSHWASRAQALLAPMLHAAAVHGRDMESVVDWVMRHELDEPGVLLEDERCSKLAFATLLGIHNTEDRERSSVFSSAADALQAYGNEHALAAATDLNFDPDLFVRSNDTVYICAPGEAQAAAAPIVCGLLSAIRRATYRAHSAGQLPRRVLFALDEAANIAPLEELPQIASEGGSQGLLLLAALQDLSQARERWKVQADGFLTLFGVKVIFPGIGDSKTLETVSTMLGEYDRQTVSRTRSNGPDLFQSQRGYSVGTQRTRVLSPGEVANIPAGHALHLQGVEWELLTLTPAHSSEPWRTLSSRTAR